MLSVLFGSKNIEKILLYLIVNRQAYATQIQHALQISLTPIQAAFHRLEKGGILQSHYEGKTRLYQFNLQYPLLQELEILLAKAYQNLSLDEKKQYNHTTESSRNILHEFWDKLHHVKELTFHAKSKSNHSGWKGHGRGIVQVLKENDSTLQFSEIGLWQGTNGTETEFKNSYRWSLEKESISLEHLRYGQSKPVFLFQLIPTGKKTLSSIEAHLCQGDTYFGKVYCESHSLRLQWRILGPKKNEEIDYYYN